MTHLAAQNIVLVGLPGSGKSKVAKALKEQFSCPVLNYGDLVVGNHSVQFTRPGSFEWQDFSALPVKHPSYSICCVIDIRSTLPAKNSAWIAEQLRYLLSISDAIVFSFTENSALDNQAWWNKWIAQNTLANYALPITRLLNQTLPAGFKGFTNQHQEQANRPKPNLSQTPNPATNHLAKLESFEFDLQQVVLEHLLMVLDNARQNLAMNITRVVGTLNTLEYQNLVAIEGTPYRWDTYAAQTDKHLGQLKISGIGLNQAWLNEMLQACQV